MKFNSPTHITTSEDGLSRIFYRFYVWDDGRVELDYCSHQMRKSKRHGWKIHKRWTRISQRDNNMERPEVPFDVQVDAVQQARQQIQFVER